jgi:hypothetical protein
VSTVAAVVKLVFALREGLALEQRGPVDYDELEAA